MWSGSLFYSLFTSFHLFDDYLPILHYRLDVEFYRSNSERACGRRLLSHLRTTRPAALFRRCARCISFSFHLTVQCTVSRLPLQRALAPAHPARADRSGAIVVKSTAVVLASSSTHLS